jgi:hypothetical protein
MKRPPDRKLVLAALVLLLAASALMSKPETGLANKGDFPTLVFKESSP